MSNKNIIAYTGPMKSGKSKILIDLYDSFIREGKSVDIFQPSMNVRDGATLKSRAYPNRVIECTPVVNPMDMLKSKADVIMLDEYFMLPLDYFKEFLKQAKTQDKKFIVAGLDYMDSGKPFTNYPVLVQYCDEEIKLTANCEFQGCELPATMSFLSKFGGSYIEGNGTVYNVYCGGHWRDLTTKRQSEEFSRKSLTK